MHNQPLTGNAGGECDEQLSPAGNIDPQPFLVHESGHRQAKKGLTGVDRLVAKRGHSLLTARAQMLFVVNE